MEQQLIQAVKNGDITRVRQLIVAGVDPVANDNYVIRWASHYGYLEVVQLLLQDPRVNPAANDNQAIRIASQNGHLEVVRLLLQDPRMNPAAMNNSAIRGA